MRYAQIENNLLESQTEGLQLTIKTLNFPFFTFNTEQILGKHQYTTYCTEALLNNNQNIQREIMIWVSKILSQIK